jgi:MFS-type transporter involved in bile tolerance (Atg22 family)
VLYSHLCVCVFVCVYAYECMNVRTYVCACVVHCVCVNVMFGHTNVFYHALLIMRIIRKEKEGVASVAHLSEVGATDADAHVCAEGINY